MKTQSLKKIGIIVAITLLGAGLGVASVLGIQQWISGDLFKTSSLIESQDDGNKATTPGEESIAAVAEKVSPSVVSIVTTNEVRSYYGATTQEGAGTGVIVSKDGYIMTNNHVIDGAKTVSVVTSDGELYENADVIGRDPLNDIAFVKIKTDKELPAATLGDSSTVRIGQQVVAIGNALGQYKNTVTSGILSGTGRPVTASTGSGQSETLTDLLQTDASINSGNSGGPLLNMAGQIIGINTAVATNANGIGFAIPINATKGILAGVLEKGAIERPFIGINYLSITPEIARTYKLPVRIGAYVFSDNSSPVAAGSPAEEAGIEKGDIIQKINTYTIGENGGLPSIIGQFRVGDKVTFTILRDGKTVTKEVILTAYKN